jgi:hypothetical protein
MIWGYEIGYYKYKSTTTPIIECLSCYPINESINEYILNQKFVEFEYESNDIKTIDGKIVALI